MANQREVLGIPMSLDCLMGGVRAVYPIKDALCLLDGAAGCNFYGCLIPMLHDNYPVRQPALGITTKTVVYGGEELLAEALERAIKVFQPNLIVVHKACIPALIGDDCEGIARTIGQKTGMKIICADTPNYRGNQMDGFNTVLNAFVEELMEDTGERKEKAVNIIGMMPGEYNWRANLREIVRLIKALGLSVNTMLIGYDISVEEIIHAPAAQANVPIYPELGLPSARLMQDKFGTPCIETELPPLGVEATREWLTRIGEFFGIAERAKRLFEEEMILLGDSLAELDPTFIPLEFLFGKTYSIETAPYLIPAMVKFLIEDLSMKPITIAFQEYSEIFEAQLQKILQENNLSAEVQTSGELSQFLESVKRNHIYPFGDPWIVFGSTPDALELSWAGQRLPVIRFSYPVYDEAIITDRPFLGLRGVGFLTERIHNALHKKIWGSEYPVGTFYDSFTEVENITRSLMVKK